MLDPLCAEQGVDVPAIVRVLKDARRISLDGTLLPATRIDVIFWLRLYRLKAPHRSATESVRPICTPQLPSSDICARDSFAEEACGLIVSGPRWVRGRHERPRREESERGFARWCRSAVCREVPSQEPRHTAARDVRYRYAAGQLEFNSARGSRGRPANPRCFGAVAAGSEPPAKMALRRWPPALSCRCGARLPERMQ